MSVNKKLYFRSKPFAAGELGPAVERVRVRVFGPGHSVRATLFRTLGDGTQQSQREADTSVLSTVCDLERENVSFVLSFEMQPDDGGMRKEVLSAQVSASVDDVLVVRVDADSVDRLREFSRGFEEELALEVALDPFTRIREMAHAAEFQVQRDIGALAERVAVLERDRTESHELTCFLSFRFEGRSIDYGRTVKQFLELLGVRVVTGQGYQPMPVNEKVRSRLAERLDLVVVIEGADGKSCWTRDEIARAQNPGVFLIPLVEDGATFDAGIFGDHEYIRFAEGHVSDAFIGLIEGIQYVGRVRAPAERDGDTIAT